MRLHLHAAQTPARPALIMDDGETVSFAELDRRSATGAMALRHIGLVAGDTVALLSSNDPRYLEAAWAAHRAGLFYAPISSYLTAGEVEYIVYDCGAKLLLASPDLASVAWEVANRSQGLQLISTGEAFMGGVSFVTLREGCEPLPPDEIVNGSPMVYSSGTTGRPKGIRRPLGGVPADRPFPIAPLMAGLFGIEAGDIYLTPAPLYHAAPLGYTMAAQDLGATAVVMRHFDAGAALSLIERHRVTHAQFVPTHFVRMLALPQAVRAAADMASIKRAFHAAAPCPAPVKEAMIAWWGPRIFEYYAGSEGVGMTTIGPDEWLAHKGSVGRAIGCEVGVFGPDDAPLPPGEVGTVAFRGGEPLDYHNDPATSAEARNRHGFTSYGDIGWLDRDGYLYLSDRKSFTIISGGVNIYPAEIELCLSGHPAVADVAVFGAPDPEMGEQVVAVVQPASASQSEDELREVLMAYASQRLSKVKLPRRMDFTDRLPREENGKLYKKALRDAYWSAAGK